MLEAFMPGRYARPVGAIVRGDLGEGSSPGKMMRWHSKACENFFYSGIKQDKHEAKMLRMHDKSCNMVKGASRCHPPRTSRFKNEDRVQTLALEDERAE